VLEIQVSNMKSLLETIRTFLQRSPETDNTFYVLRALELLQRAEQALTLRLDPNMEELHMLLLKVRNQLVADGNAALAEDVDAWVSNLQGNP